jgi:hypothetical protein
VARAATLASRHAAVTPRRVANIGDVFVASVVSQSVWLVTAAIALPLIEVSAL